MWRALIFGAILFAGGTHAWDETLPAAAVPVPALKARVTDLTNTLSGPERERLEAKLAQWESRSGNQLAVLMVSRTKPEAIEQYAIRVAEAWKIGKRGMDNGVLLLIAKEEKKIRLEVGYGLEGSIPDATARRIVSEVIAPRFKSGKFYEGIDAGIDRVIDLTTGSAKMEGAPSASKKESAAWNLSGNWEGLLIAGLVALVMIGTVLRFIFGNFFGAVVGGALAGGIGWLITSSLMPALLIGIVVLVLLLLVPGLGQGGGWSGGYGGGGWSGGGSSGGWSGGGGEFGGGGASGSWGEGGGDGGGGD